jgi:hemolysin activation/secretion protein
MRWALLAFVCANTSGQVGPSQPDVADVELPSAYVRDFRFEGNTVFTDGELWMVVGDFVRRDLTMGDLEQARQALTLHYIAHGYINSGVILQDQTLTNGVVTFTVIEGRLAQVQVDGTRRLRSRYVQSRIQSRTRSPLSLPAMQEALQLLRRSPAIERVNAELKPGPIPGASLLQVAVTEANPWQAGLVFRNDRPPSVGAETLELIGSHANVAGFSDELALRYAILRRGDDGFRFPGLDDLGVSYTIPVSARDTTVQLFYERSDSSVIEEPFDDLDVSSETLNLGGTIRHPFLRTVEREVALGLTLERRASRTFLLGEPFSLSPGAEDGETAATVLRVFQEWVERDQERVLALRSTFSWGLDWWHPTKQGFDPDALFASWLGQAQYIRRLGRTQHQLVLNSTLQWANEPLLALEQFSLGGVYTVRGYRENQLVRDMGWLASAELRLAAWVSGRGDPLLQIVPFFDYGRGWNARDPTPRPSDLASTGIGLIFTPHRKVTAKMYWGYAFRQFDAPEEDLQDLGLHFHFTALAF